MFSFSALISMWGLRLMSGIILHGAFTWFTESGSLGQIQSSPVRLVSLASLAWASSVSVFWGCNYRWATRSIQYFFSSPGVMLTWQHCKYWAVSSFLVTQVLCGRVNIAVLLQVLLLLLVSALTVEPELVLNSLPSTPSLFSAGMTGVCTECHFPHFIGGESHSEKSGGMLEVRARHPKAWRSPWLCWAPDNAGCHLSSTEPTLVVLSTAWTD